MISKGKNFKNFKDLVANDDKKNPYLLPIHDFHKLNNETQYK